MDDSRRAAAECRQARARARAARHEPEPESSWHLRQTRAETPRTVRVKREEAAHVLMRSAPVFPSGFAVYRMVVTTGFPHATNTLEVGRCELYCDEVLWHHQPYECDFECQPEETTGRIKPEPEEPTVEPEPAASVCCVADSRVEPPAVSHKRAAPCHVVVCDDDDLMVLCDARVLEAVTALLGYSDSCLLDCVTR